jgi:hypothetical protein
MFEVDLANPPAHRSVEEVLAIARPSRNGANRRIDARSSVAGAVNDKLGCRQRSSNGPRPPSLATAGRLVTPKMTGRAPSAVADSRHQWRGGVQNNSGLCQGHDGANEQAGPAAVPGRGWAEESVLALANEVIE